MVRSIVAVAVGKSIYWLLRKTGRHGGALPGLVVEKIHPGLLRVLHDLPDGLIVVSGTNGKTTTTHLLSEALRRSGKKVFTNHSGSNMTRGLLASIVRYADYKARLKCDIAVLEIDEAYAAKLAPLLKPRVAILTNVLRDQLDRFGEIDTTAKLLEKLALHSKMVVYNICDPRLKAIGDRHKNSFSYGYVNSLAEHFPSDDAWYGEAKKVPSASVSLIDRTDGESIYKHASKTVKINTQQLPGWHNALNLASVLAVLEVLGVDTDLNDLLPPYGRGEVITYRGCELVLQLVKNPGGFRVAMDVAPDQPALIVINDKIADSRDVSWLWDVDVRPLADRPAVHVSGIRAYDMANRLKYADIACEGCIDDIPSAIEDFAHQHKRGVVFLTYTSMLEARKFLRSTS